MTSNELAGMSEDERKLAASNPATSPDALRELAADWRLVGEVASNPSTPTDVLSGIYFDFPHLRPKATAAERLGSRIQWEASGPGATPARDAEIDRAIEHLRPKKVAPARAPASKSSSGVDGGAPAKAPLSGAGMLIAAVALFGVCSLVQNAYGTSMFDSSYIDPGGVGELLITATYWPGWLGSGVLALRGLVDIFSNPSKK